MLTDFLEDIFGSQESISFHKAMRDIDSQLRETLGYYLTELCSSENKLLFKKEMESHLLSFDYDLMKQNSLILMREKNKWAKDLFWGKYAAIKKQFIENGRYKLLLGKKDFAESFFSSEWLIYKTEDSSLLDNTYKVAGYLKSVEELLWDIIILLGEGRTIAGKAYGEQYQINEKNYNDINATLGSLQRFLSDYSNQDLFLDAFGDGRRFVSDYLKQQISFWRDNYRNGYFHKHNLNDLEKVKQIRNQTIFLYMMILGSLDLRTEDLEELMY